jgi:prevent-host-death family protein
VTPDRSAKKPEVGAYEAKTRLAELLQRVEAGERITITRHGHPVAQLVPVAGAAQETVEETVRELAEFRSTHSLGPTLTVEELVRGGRSR